MTSSPNPFQRSPSSPIMVFRRKRCRQEMSPAPVKYARFLGIPSPICLLSLASLASSLSTGCFSFLLSWTPSQFHNGLIPSSQNWIHRSTRRKKTGWYCSKLGKTRFNSRNCRTLRKMSSIVNPRQVLQSRN